MYKLLSMTEVISINSLELNELTETIHFVEEGATIMDQMKDFQLAC